MADLVTKRLSDLTFDDLCIEIEDENYQNIRDALRRMTQKVRINKTKKFAVQKTREGIRLLGAIAPQNSAYSHRLRHHHS